MSNISSLTSSSSSSSSTSTQDIYNGHIFGLASGLDVDNIVTGLTEDIQSQIDKAGQQKQTLQWKQTDYQAVVTSLNTFNSAYLALSGSSSITGTDALQTYTANSDSAYVTATAEEGATGTPASLTVYQNAATASISGSATSQVITTDVDLSNGSSGLTALEGNAFDVTVDGVTETITLSADDVSTYGDAAGALQHELNSAFGWDDSSSSVNGPRLTVSMDSSSGYVTFSPGSYTYSATDGSGNSVEESTTYNTSFYLSGVSSTDSNGNTTVDTTGLAALTGSTSSLSNRLNRNLTVADLLDDGATSSGTYSVTVNGKQVQVDGSDSIFTALKKINAADTGVTLSYSSTTGIISATASSSGAASNFSLGTGQATDTSTGTDISTDFLTALGFSSDQISGSSTSTLAGSQASGVTAGQDAVFSIDGGATRMARSSNAFTLNNVDYTINGTVSSSSPVTANITFTQDTGTAVKNIQNFVTAYNTLLATITTYTNTKPDADYQPLTDSQKESMSDSEITDWNAKASAGVLFDDDTLNGLEQDLRDMVNQSVTTSDGTTISLADLGIHESTENTGADDTTPGQLVFDNDSTDTLVSMLQNHAQEVQDLFTMQSSDPYVINDSATVTSASGATVNRQTDRKNTEGIAYRLQDIVSDYTTTGDPSASNTEGKLISLLGSSIDGDSLNSIYDQITKVNTKITDLKTKLTDKKNALYSKFSTLESFMAKMNSQSGVLSSLSSSSGS